MLFRVTLRGTNKKFKIQYDTRRPFAVINTRILPYGLGHEIGHVFGCGHHEYSGGPRTFPLLATGGHAVCVSCGSLELPTAGDWGTKAAK